MWKSGNIENIIGAVTEWSLDRTILVGAWVFVVVSIALDREEFQWQDVPASIAERKQNILLFLWKAVLAIETIIFCCLVRKLQGLPNKTAERMTSIICHCVIATSISLTLSPSEMTSSNTFVEDIILSCVEGFFVYEGFDTAKNFIQVKAKLKLAVLFVMATFTLSSLLSGRSGSVWLNYIFLYSSCVPAISLPELASAYFKRSIAYGLSVKFAHVVVLNQLAFFGFPLFYTVQTAPGLQNVNTFSYGYLVLLYSGAVGLCLLLNKYIEQKRLTSEFEEWTKLENGIQKMQRGTKRGSQLLIDYEKRDDVS